MKLIDKLLDLVLWLVFAFLLTIICTADLDAKEHQYQLPNGPTIIMDCARFAQMYSSASIMGADNFEAWLRHNVRSFNKGELTIYKYEIKALLRRRNGEAITFPQAMMHCGDVWI